MFAQAVHGRAQLLTRHHPIGPAPQHAANAFGRIGEHPLEPAIKGFVRKGLRFLVGGNLEQRVDARLDRALVKKVGAEGVDRTDARQLQLLQRTIEPSAVFRLGRAAHRLNCAAKVKLGFPGCFFGESDRDDAVERAKTGADEPDDPPYERGRLSSSGRCLDKKGRAEFRRDAAARFAVCEFRHGAPRKAISRSILSRGLRAMRRSSCGPHTA